MNLDILLSNSKGILKIRTLAKIATWSFGSAGELPRDESQPFCFFSFCCSALSGGCTEVASSGVFLKSPTTKKDLC